MNEYLYLVLVPVAEVFRNAPEIKEGQKPFAARFNAKACRVEFIHGPTEKKWQKFCEKHGLKNDPTLKY